MFRELSTENESDSEEEIFESKMKEKRDHKQEENEEKEEQEEEDDSDSDSDSEAQDDVIDPNKEIMLDELTDAELEEDIIPRQRLTTNKKEIISNIANSLNLDLPWIETQSITSTEPVQISDVDNDIERELAFYKQALQAAHLGRKLILESGTPFSRPDDYFAEMLKSDEHMQKVRTRLLNEQARIKASEDAKKQRELKKFGKKVQVERIMERQKEKTRELEKIKDMKRKRKGIEDTAVDDDFDIALEAAANDGGDGNPRHQNKRQKTGINKKRVKKDAKFGFGGKKRFLKSNTAESSGDVSGFNVKKMKGGWGSKIPSRKKLIKPQRPGKDKRQAMRNRKR